MRHQEENLSVYFSDCLPPGFAIHLAILLEEYVGIVEHQRGSLKTDTVLAAVGPVLSFIPTESRHWFFPYGRFCIYITPKSALAEKGQPQSAGLFSVSLPYHQDLEGAGDHGGAGALHPFRRVGGHVGRRRGAQ